MGQLVNGVWRTSDVRQGEDNDRGEFIRKPMRFRNQIDPSGDFLPDSGRYHLYVSYACPWAHRTLIMRQLKGLSDHISVDVVSPTMLDEGWTFDKSFDKKIGDSLGNALLLREIYLSVDPHFSGRVTVPVLWDKKKRTIVNNESSEIILMLNSAFDDLTGNTVDYFPHEKRAAIEEWNEKIYDRINNGVYRCGFARSQEAYEEAFHGLYAALDEVEAQLSTTRFLTGEELTLADVRLFPTLLRYDPVYHTHFKCNGKLIREYPYMSRFLKDVMTMEGVASTVRMDHIKHHYYFSHTTINPSQIVPLGLIN